MNEQIRVLGPGDASVLDRTAEGVFDFALDPAWTRAFLADPSCHMAVAIEDGVVVGFASGVRHLHPDKPLELFVNEVGVAPSHQRRGLGRQIFAALLDHARGLGCVNAWVLTDPDNAAGNGLYAALGGAKAAGLQAMYEFDLRKSPSA